MKAFTPPASKTPKFADARSANSYRLTLDSKRNLGCNVGQPTFTWLVGKCNLDKLQNHANPTAIFVSEKQRNEGGSDPSYWKFCGPHRLLWFGLADDGEFSRAEVDAQDDAVETFFRYTRGETGNKTLARWGFSEGAREGTNDGKKRTIRQDLVRNKLLVHFALFEFVVSGRASGMPRRGDPGG